MELGLFSFSIFFFPNKMELGFGKSESIPFYKMNSTESFRITSSLSSLLLSATLYKNHNRSNSILSLTKLKGVKNYPLKKVHQSMAATALDKSVPEKLPPLLEATADQPPLFDGIIRLYTAYICPFAQRVWITRNYKGLQDKINLVPLDLQNRPSWYKEKVYSVNKVPALEHNGKIIGESLDLIKYLDSNFEGPSLLPDDPAKKEFAEELFSYTDTFNQIVLTSFKGDAAKEAVPAFDYLENALHKFDDGPFLLGQFSLVDIAYIPFVERFQIFLSEVFKYDVTTGRPKLSAWIEEINKIEAYKQTKRDPKEFIELYKKRFQIQ